MLDHYAYTLDKAALQRYLPLVTSVVDFYAHHFSTTGSDGKIIIFPTQVFFFFFGGGGEYEHVRDRPENYASCVLKRFHHRSVFVDLFDVVTNHDLLHHIPTKAIETWQCPGYPPSSSECATNDAPTVAGLHAVLPRLLALPQG